MSPISRHHPVSEGQTRDLITAEWRGLMHDSRSGRRVATVFGVLLCAAAVGLLCVGYNEHTRPTEGTDASDWQFCLFMAPLLVAFGGFMLRLGLRRPAERPGGRARRVSRLRGVFALTGNPAQTTIGGVPVRIADAWTGRFPLLDIVDVEVTPPVDPANPDRRRWTVQIRDVVSAYDGRLWAGDLAPSARLRTEEILPAVDARAIAQARVAGARPLTDVERQIATRLVTEPDLLGYTLPLLGAWVGGGVVGAVALWPEWFPVAVFLAFALAGVAAGLEVLRRVRRPHWAGRPDDFVRGGPLRGRVALVGAPPRTYVAGVRVALLPYAALSEGTEIEVTVTPPLADDADPQRGRIAAEIKHSTVEAFGEEASRWLQ